MKSGKLYLEKIPQKNINNRDNNQGSSPSRELNLVATANNFIRSQSVNIADLYQVFQTLMKKSIKQMKQFELQARDRQVLLDLPQSNKQRLEKHQLLPWITNVCRNVTSSAFHSYMKDQLNYEQTKTFCSQGILKNIVNLVKKFRGIQKKDIQLINEHIKDEVVPYLKRKYPMTQSSDVNKALEDAVKAVDNSQAIQNDLLQKTEIVFVYNEEKNYNKLIMKFLNWLITNIDTKQFQIKDMTEKQKKQNKKTVYEQFYNYISNIFSKVQDQSWMNQKAVDSSSKTKQQKQQEIKKIETSNNQSTRQKYKVMVKQYTSYIIGRKISKNVPVYTEQQIQSGNLKIKSPAILRILTKWCDQLWQKFTKKNYFLDRQQNIRVQQVGGNVNTMFMWMKKPLNEYIELQKKEIQQFMDTIQTNNIEQQYELLKHQIQNPDQFYHIQQNEKISAKFGFKILQNLHSYIVLYINRIIHGLLKVSKKLYQQKLSTKARWTSPPDLITFKVGDIMRCKMSSKQRQILRVYQQLKRISEADSKKLKIYRVKNRLRQGTNDILMNVLYNNKYLCQIQLAVKTSHTKFIMCSNSFNHYIYQVGRTIFGPLTQLSSVWMSLDSRNQQYARVIQTQKNDRRVNQQQCVTTKEHKLSQKNYDHPFICSFCQIAYSHTNYIYPHKQCVQCKMIICAKCQLQKQDDKKLINQLLSKDHQNLKQVCTQVVTYSQILQKRLQLPQYGVCVQIQSKLKKVQKFRKIKIKNIEYIYGIKSGQKGKQKVYLIQQLLKKKSQKKFLQKYVVIKIQSKDGPKYIDITQKRAMQEYVIPQKIKDIYKKQKQIISLIDQGLSDQTIKVIINQKDRSLMDNIGNMELADNKLTNIKIITQNFRQLQRLQLSRNKIVDISTISYLKHLKKLNLRNNQLKSLPDQLCQLVQLQGLNIRQNKIAAFPQQFGSLINLQKLQSDKNPIRQLPKSFQKLIKLTFIDLSKTKLKQVPPCFQNFIKLKQLVLSSISDIKQLPNWISKLTNLNKLNLSQTQIKQIPSSLYNLKSLQILKIKSIQNELPKQISNLNKLKQLELNLINVKQIPRQMSQLISLQSLQIKSCKLDAIPSIFSQMKLKHLSFINNSIKTISQQLVGLQNSLVQLQIQGQQITTLPQNMNKFILLRSLSLSNNKLKVLPAFIKKFNKLYQLNISKNQLEQLDNDLLSNLTQLESFNLEQNKLKCFPSSLLQTKKLKIFNYKNKQLVIKQIQIQKIKQIENALEQDFSLKFQLQKIKKANQKKE